MARRKGRRNTGPQDIEAKERALKALELRKEGKSFDEIASEVGYNSRQAAHDAVKRTLDAMLREPAEAVRALDLERLDAMFGIHYLNAQAGDVQALDAALKIMARRARLLGLDAPEKKELAGPGGAPLQPPMINVGFGNGAPGADPI